MSDPTNDYLAEFYGPSTKWFSLVGFICLSFAMLSAVIFIILTLSSKSLRKIRTNWFLVAMSCSDFLHCAAMLTGSLALSYGNVENRSPCARAGFLVVSTAICTFGFPPMIAAERFYKISKMPASSSKPSILRLIFSDRMTVPMIVIWFLISYSTGVPLLLNDLFGEDPVGFCGAKKFISVGWLIYYESAGISVFFVGLVITAVYYCRLSRWLKQRQSLLFDEETIKVTRQLMKAMTIVTLLPAVLGTPVIVLTGGQMFLPDIPIGISRLIITPYYLITCANPWLTILLVRPFRQRFFFLICRKKRRIGQVETIDPLDP